MAIEAERVRRALELDRGWLAGVRAHWNALADLAVWGRLGSGELGALPRLRKRVLELGEKLAAIGAPRAWIPRPREQLKSALAAALAARQALAQCEQACAGIDGEDCGALAARLDALRASFLAPLEELAQRWARLLDRDIGEASKELDDDGHAAS